MKNKPNHNTGSSCVSSSYSYSSQRFLNLPQDDLNSEISFSPPPSCLLSAKFSLPCSPEKCYDRFIPSRKASNFASFSLFEQATANPSTSTFAGGNSAAESREDTSAAYSALLRRELFPSSCENRFSSANSFGNVLKFRSSTGKSSSKSPSPFAVSPFGSKGDLCDPLLRRKSSRKISRSPFKVLDAPALQDDFYLNLVDWSWDNILAVGLGSCVYLWSATSSKVTKLCDLGLDDSVCSVAWTQRGTFLAVGTNLGQVQIWDTTRCKRLRSMGGHRSRAGTLAWNSHTLASGSRDRSILQRDVRSQDDYVFKFPGHKSEVCGLKWSSDDRELASGGNDNQLCIWKTQSSHPVLRFNKHTAAVKAIAWSPHQHGLLASGGGTADRCVWFWNTTTNTSLNYVDTGSQVCNLVWSKNVNEIVSTHGYSQNQIIVWRYPSLSKLATLTGHTLRVLYLAISPDGQTIVTGAGDETLRFWNVFPSSKTEGAGRDMGMWSSGRTYIR